jgi:hypothetical protein
MKPSGFPKKVVIECNFTCRHVLCKRLSEGCPFGTVPIKRVGKEEFIVSKIFTEKQNSHPTDIASFAAFHVSHSFLMHAKM